VARSWLCFVLVLPNYKRHKEEKYIFDEKGVKVFILKNR